MIDSEVVDNVLISLTTIKNDLSLHNSLYTLKEQEAIRRLAEDIQNIIMMNIKTNNRCIS